MSEVVRRDVLRASIERGIERACRHGLEDWAAVRLRRVGDEATAVAVGLQRTAGVGCPLEQAFPCRETRRANWMQFAFGYDAAMWAAGCRGQLVQVES